MGTYATWLFFITKIDGSLFGEYVVEYFIDHPHFLLRVSMAAHLYDLYYQFHSHNCGPSLYRQLWMVLTLPLEFIIITNLRDLRYI